MRATSTLVRIIVISAAVHIVSPGAADPPCFRGLGDLPGGIVSSQAYAVSGNGRVVVGWSSSDSGNEAFRWEGGIMEGLGSLPPGDLSSYAYGVSTDGSTIVGTSGVSGGSAIWAVRWRDGVVTDLSRWTDDHFQAHAVSDDGNVIVGWGRYNPGHGYTYKGAVWWNNFIIQLGDTWVTAHAYDVSGDGLLIVGDHEPDENSYGQACYWYDGTLTYIGDLPGGATSSNAYAVTPDGTVIVGRSTSDNGSEAFHWEAGSMDGLGDLPGGDFQSQAEGVSGDGTVVVGWGSTDVWLEAFIWDADTGMRNLRDVLETDFGLDLTGWTLFKALGISDDGRTIVGQGNNPNGESEGWLARLAPVTGTCPGDLDFDGDVDVHDLAELLSVYGQNAGGDLDCDCATGLSDLSLLLSVYGTACD